MRDENGIPAQGWRFGAVELDQATGTVRVAGEPCDLPRSSVAVLFALARAGGDVVAKRELLELGWPGRIVHENSLAKSVGTLRRTLGADGEAIEVAHGYGYRLAAPVERIGTAEHEVRPPESTPSATPLPSALPAEAGRGARRWPWVIAGFLAGALLATGAVRWWPGNQGQAPATLSSAPTLLSFLSEDLLQRADPYSAGNDDDSLRAAVVRAAGRIDERLTADPAIASALHATVADAFSGWGEYEKAVAHLQRARVLASSAPGTQSGAVARIDIALCQQLRLAGDTRAAERVCARAVSAVDFLDKDDTMRARIAQAKLLFEIGSYEQAVALLRPIAAGSADAQWFLGLSLRKLAQYPEAETAFRTLVATQRKQHGDTHPLTAWAYADYGDYLVDIGRYEESRHALAQAQAIFDASLGADHPESLSPRYSLAVMHLSRSEWEPAAALLRPVLARYRETLGTDHLWTLYTITELALAEAGLGKHETTSALLDEAARNGTRVLYRRPAKAAHFQLRWARAWLLAGDPARAGKTLDLADTALAAAFAHPHPWHARASCLRARLAIAEDRPANARERADACLRELQQAKVPESHPLLAEAEGLLASR